MTHAVIKQLPLGPMMNFAYLIGDDEEDACAAVDPGWDAKAIVDAASGAGWIIQKILLTHVHFDHANAIEKLVKITKAPAYVHRDEAGELKGMADVRPTDDGIVIEVGGLKVGCLHTPGHTPGSQCFLVDGALLTGDTLFVDGCGRVDLPGSDPRKMLSSLKRIAKLDPATIVYPGHDYGPSPTSTIAEQLRNNPCLGATSEAMLL